jgi:hypothetical protein
VGYEGACALLCALSASLGSAVVHAYRPFDGTDASVAEPGEFEVELGPLGRLREGPESAWIGPAVVANWGLGEGRELVLEGKVRTLEGEASEADRTSLVDDALCLKQVHRRGSLQDPSGISIASECGVLLPNMRGASGTGATCAAIASHRMPAATIHVNAALSFTREHDTARFTSVILEGHHIAGLRPVMELAHEHENRGPTTRSALAGVIWRAKEGLAFDAALRGGRSGGEEIREIRLGLTWAFDLRQGTR